MIGTRPRALALAALVLLLTSGRAARPAAPGPERVRVELLQLAVTVIDRAGNPVRDLRREDFLLTEDGQRIEIAVFDPPEARAVPRPEAGAQTGASGPAAPPDIASLAGQPASEAPPRQYIVVFDGYNNPGGLRFQAARRAAVGFVDGSLRDGDRIAVIEMRPEARVLTDLTSDRGILRDALERASILPGSAQGIGPLIDSAITDTAAKDIDLATERLRNLARFNQILEASGQRAFYDGLTAIGEGVASLPGRKHILLFSGGFPFLSSIEQIYGYADYFPSSFRKMVDQLARSNVSIYTLNIGDESFGADAGRAGNVRLSLARTGMDENLLEHLGLDAVKFGADPFRTRQTLAVLAGQTGGRFLDVGDYGEALRSIDQEIRAAYTLGYYPANTIRDGRFRKIEVRVKGQPRLQVQHRTGYFSPRPYEAMDQEERRLLLADAAMGKIQRDDLPLETAVGSLPAAEGNTLVTVILEIPMRALEIAPSLSGDRHDLDVVLLAKGGAGRIVDSVTKSVAITLDRDHLPPPGGGLRLVESLTFPPGDGELQLVARDSAGGAMTTRSLPLRVPTYGAASLSLTSLFLMTLDGTHALVDRDFVPAATRRRLVREAGSRGPKDRVPPGPAVADPFTFPDGFTFQPTARRTFLPGEEILVFVRVLNLVRPEQGPRVSVTFDLKDTKVGRIALPSSQAIVTEDARSPYSAVYRLALQGVAPGEYALRVTAIDETARVAVQGAEPVRIGAN